MSQEIRRIYEFDAQLIKLLFLQSGMPNSSPNEGFFGNERNVLLVSYYDGAPSGFLYGYALEALNSCQPKMFLYSIDVFPSFRKKGIGTALIEEFTKIASSLNCSKIFVLTNGSNQAAMRLYEKTGGKRENPDDVMYVYDLGSGATEGTSL